MVETCADVHFLEPNTDTARIQNDVHLPVHFCLSRRWAT